MFDSYILMTATIMAAMGPTHPMWSTQATLKNFIIHVKEVDLNDTSTRTHVIYATTNTSTKTHIIYTTMYTSTKTHIIYATMYTSTKTDIVFATVYT